MRNTLKRISAIALAFTLLGTGKALTKTVAPQYCNNSITAYAKVTNGWENVGPYWYYYRNSQKVKNEWVKDGGYYYYLGPDGIMYTDWHKIDKKWYYFRTNGSMYIGELGYNGHVYLLGKDGAMVQGITNYNGYKYCFNWQEDTGERMDNCHFQYHGSYYISRSNGTLHTEGWFKWGGFKHYAYPSGKLALGRVIINGERCEFDKRGNFIRNW